MHGPGWHPSRWWRRLGTAWRRSSRTSTSPIDGSGMAGPGAASDGGARPCPADGLAVIRHPSRNELRDLCAELVADCEDYLAGHYAERLATRSLVVPVWAWTNLLAHGAEDDLRREVEEFAEPRPSRGWRSARAYLVTELLEALGRGSVLEELQQQAIVPLELELAARPEVASWDRVRWVLAVRSALDAYSRSHRS